MTRTLEDNLDGFFGRYPAERRVLKQVNSDAVVGRFKVRQYNDSGKLELLDGDKVIDATDIKINFPIDDKPMRVVLLGGFGLGVDLQILLQRRESHGIKNIVVIEPDVERFIFALMQTDFRKLFEDRTIEWCVGLTKDECFARFFNDFRYVNRSVHMNSYVFLKHPFLGELNPAYWASVEDEYRAAIAQIRKSYGYLEDSLLGFKNIIENREFIENHPGIRGLQNIYEGRPAVVVAAGPSLKRSLPLLKSKKDSCVIVATDATLSLLLSEGIEPQFVLSLERVLTTKKFFENKIVQESNCRTQLVCYPLVPKEVIDVYKGPKRVAYRDISIFYTLEDLMPRGFLTSSTSVAHMCCRLADYLGCSQIALIGQDLCYDPDSFQSHSEGLAYEEWAKPQKMEELEKKAVEEGLGKIVWLPGNKRRQVPSNSIYFSMLKEYSWEVSKIKAQVINCTDGGARIPGVIWSEFSKVLEPWETFDAWGTLAATNDQELLGASKLDLSIISNTLDSLTQKMQSLLTETKKIQGDRHFSSAELKSQALHIIRQGIENLTKERFFVAFIGEMNGLDFLKIENEWHAIKDNQRVEKGFPVVENWLSAMIHTARQVRACL
ncbi:MAG: hypothetical protein COV44_02535 [Deltaproteobacteria bacterium CG11_big_fil_rev_8_21_14_0_20_45_16]|nr:MAG: hypothetical protein COV44_02535 [Deltaproteobacteria bacterium CG11_big_fil_rev_8_21_14_0_20_45_16]